MRRARPGPPRRWCRSSSPGDPDRRPPGRSPGQRSPGGRARGRSAYAGLSSSTRWVGAGAARGRTRCPGRERAGTTARNPTPRAAESRPPPQRRAAPSWACDLPSREAMSIVAYSHRRRYSSTIEDHMLHTVLIVLHATAAVASFGAGALSLGLYMVWRGAQAGARLRRQAGDWRPRYIDDIGFTLIALFEGFVIVSAIDLGAPVWLVILVAVAGVVAGNLVIRRVKAQLSA